MAHDTPNPSVTVSRCRSCGYEAEAGGDGWNRIDAPPFSGVTQCPECGSTDVISGR
ncbi:MAG: hypothetical protein ACQETB_00245 [Halobacteriota archaeon]